MRDLFGGQQCTRGQGTRCANAKSLNCTCDCGGANHGSLLVGSKKEPEQEKKILDVCCGGRMFWLDKHHPNTLYVDNRILPKERLLNRQNFEVAPDVIMDFRRLDIKNDSFSLVVFDPPHLKRSGDKGWLVKKYGRLDKGSWKDDLRKGFSECFRVLKKDGVLVFKWSETEVSLKEVLALTSVRPLFGHRPSSSTLTHWVVFMKL